MISCIGFLPYCPFRLWSNKWLFPKQIVECKLVLQVFLSKKRISWSLLAGITMRRWKESFLQEYNKSLECFMQTMQKLTWRASSMLGRKALEGPSSCFWSQILRAPCIRPILEIAWLVGDKSFWLTSEVPWPPLCSLYIARLQKKADNQQMNKLPDKSEISKQMRMKRFFKTLHLFNNACENYSVHFFCSFLAAILLRI